MGEKPDYQAMLEAVVADLPLGRDVEALGGYTLVDLLAALNKVGIGPEDVEVSGNGENFGIRLGVYMPFDDEDDDDDDPEPEPSPQPEGSAHAS